MVKVKPRALTVPAVQNKGYSHAGASYTKKSLKGFVVSSGSPAEDINANNYTLRQRSRMLYMSAPLASGALKRQRTNVVGSGLRLKSTIDRDVLGISQEQAEAFAEKLSAEFADDPQKAWQTSFFGRTLDSMVREGLSAKLMRMPADAQQKVQETLTRMVNEGDGGMICILL